VPCVGYLWTFAYMWSLAAARGWPSALILQFSQPAYLVDKRNVTRRRYELVFNNYVRPRIKPRSLSPAKRG